MSDSLTITLKKCTDGATRLHCTRANHTQTSQTRSNNAEFFAAHDIAHFALETTLRCQKGFFGLIAQGWNIEDLSGKSPRGPLPEELGIVESMLSTIETLNNSGRIWHLDEFNELSPRKLSAADLQRIRELRTKLMQMWASLQPGASMELQFPGPGI